MPCWYGIDTSELHGFGVEGQRLALGPVCGAEYGGNGRAYALRSGCTTGYKTRVGLLRLLRQLPIEGYDVERGCCGSFISFSGHGCCTRWRGNSCSDVALTTYVDERKERERKRDRSARLGLWSLARFWLSYWPL